MHTLISDVRYALRQLRNHPGFTAVALITLALCLGANLSIFAVVDSILLRPLPFPEADRLVVLYNSYPKAGKDRDRASLTSYYERRGNIAAFEKLAAINNVTTVVGETGATEREDVGRVTPEFFATLGVPMAMGRAFNESEMTYQTDQAAILTDSYWREHFNADPNVLGRDIRSDGIPRKIVGVLPPSFRFLSSRARIFLPLSSEEGERNLSARHSNNVVEIARLKPGVTVQEAQAQIDAHNNAHAAEFRSAKEVAAAGFQTIVAPLHADHVASIRPTLLLLQAGALFLLLMGGVNLVNLLLIRASDRVKELAVRQSMGAGRWHVVRQVMTETVLLALVGGVLGLVVGAGGIRLLSVLGAEQLPLGANIAFDGRLAFVAVLAAVALGAVIAIPLAWFNLNRHLANALQSESRSGTTTRSTQRLRHILIVAQIALAFVLLAGAGLLGLSLKRAMAVPPGFRTDHVLTGQFQLPWKGYHTGDAFYRFVDPLLATGSHLPGVLALGGISGVPLTGEHGSNVLTVIGYNPAPGESVVAYRTYGVFGDYFSAIGMQLREGRFLNEADNHVTLQVCVVDEDLARRYWPHGGAVGQQLHLGAPGKVDPSQVFTIVGVVGNVKQVDLTESHATGAVYFPYMRTFNRSYFLVARTSLPPDSLAVALRKLVRDADPEIPLSDIRSMQARVDESLTTRRSPAMLTGIFAAVALVLAAVGIYGVLSYAVAQRHREIGVRIALGALPKQVLNQFLGLGVRLLAPGTVLGMLGAWGAGRAMQTILFGVTSVQPLVLAATFAVTMLVVLLACLIPARRAAKVDPMVALRYE
jgi:predicted permease